MLWAALIKKLKDAGYEGRDDDLPAVQDFLEQKFPNGVTSDGKEIDIEAEHAKAYPSRLDVNGDAAELEKLRQENAILREQAELEAPPIKVAGKVDHSAQIARVKVGKMRLADDPTGGFKHVGELLFQVKEHELGRTDQPELEAWTKATLSTYGNETAGADGGFAVPPQFSDSILSQVEGEDSLLARCDQMPVAGNSFTQPTDTTTPWGSSGIQVYWEGEAGSITQSKPVLRERTWKLRKVTALVPVTDELLEDAPAIGTFVPRKAAEHLDFKIGEGIVRGVGAGQPLGIMNSAALISVATESGQDADTIVATNVQKMWMRMYAPYRRNAVWLINQDCETQLQRMFVQGVSDAGTNVAAGGLVYLPANGLSGTPYNTLMGRPVIPTQHCETVGDLGDIILADLSQYLCITKARGLDAATSIHLWFDQSVTAFRFVFRMDGAPWHDGTISPRDGSNTMSAFVALAARA